MGYIQCLPIQAAELAHERYQANEEASEISSLYDVPPARKQAKRSPIRAAKSGPTRVKGRSAQVGHEDGEDRNKPRVGPPY